MCLVHIVRVHQAGVTRFLRLIDLPTSSDPDVRVDVPTLGTVGLDIPLSGGRRG